MTHPPDRLAALEAMPGQLDTKEALVHWYCTHRKTIMDALTATVDQGVVSLLEYIIDNSKCLIAKEASQQALLRLRGEG